MARAKIRRPAPSAKTRGSVGGLSEDWIATLLGIAIILVIRLADVNVQWPLFEWFKK